MPQVYDVLPYFAARSSAFERPPLRKPDKESDERLLDGCGAYLRIIIPEELEWEFFARTWGHEIAGARRDLGACLDG